jgi:hypothetical protein
MGTKIVSQSICSKARKRGAMGGGLPVTDQELIIFALKDVGRVIAEHLDPGRTRDPEETLTRLIRILDRPEIQSAIGRLEQGLRGL